MSQSSFIHLAGRSDFKMPDGLSEDPVGERRSLLDFLANGEDVEVYVESNTSVT